MPDWSEVLFYQQVEPVMARREEDREDLIREATALIVRGEWQVAGISEPVVAGFRRGGELSVYFGGDPCFHFDVNGRLRRAFADGFLYRTQGATLARLERKRTDTQTELHRTDLDEVECERFLFSARQQLEQFREQLACGAATLLREVPDDSDIEAKLISKLSEILNDLQLAPPIPTRRL